MLLGPIGTTVGRLLHSPCLAVGMTISVANGWLWLMMVVRKFSKAGRYDVFARPIRSTHQGLFVKLNFGDPKGGRLTLPTCIHLILLIHRLNLVLSTRFFSSRELSTSYRL